MLNNNFLDNKNRIEMVILNWDEKENASLIDINY